MLEGLFIASLIGTCYQAIKEACQPTIPAENWANKELIRQDRNNNISEKEFSKNLANGKYKLTEKHPEPHRMADGRIIIENTRLYKEDVRKFGVVQAHQWMRQGKYNLSPEKLKEEEEYYKQKMEYLFSLL